MWFAFTRGPKIFCPQGPGEATEDNEVRELCSREELASGKLKSARGSGHEEGGVVVVVVVVRGKASRFIDKVVLR